MNAKYSSKCPECKQPINIGQVIGKLGGVWRCEPCTNSIASAPQGEAAARAAGYTQQEIEATRAACQQVAEEIRTKGKDKVWTRADVVAMLNGSPAAVERALITLFERQTSDEQQTDTTRHENGRGFSAADAGLFSFYAKQIQDGKHLRPGQLNRCRRNGRIQRYTGQLLEEIALKGGKVAHSELIEDPNAARMAEKAEFARLEAEQEQQAFLSDPAFRAA